MKNESKKTNKGETTTRKTSKIDPVEFAAVGYTTFMAVYFGCALDAPLWDFLFFFSTNLLTLALAVRLRKYEKRRVYLVIVVLQVLGLLYNAMFYLLGVTAVSQVAGLFFLIGLLSLIFMRKK